ncbi:MAG: hypothetical protein N2201_00845 [candidate division WOR-3 bacterium]|nr:hypothetical protein [candidate division WOR-3 bacterium]
MLVGLIFLINLLPLSLAIYFSQLIILTYLLLKPQYRKEIYFNYLKIIGRKDKYFWIKNALGVGKNLALMIKTDNNTLDCIQIRGEKIFPKIEQNSGKKIRGSNKEAIRDGNDKILDNKKIKRENIMMSNQPCVVVSFHFGPWELLPKIFARSGYEILLSVQNQQDQRLNNYLTKKRSNNNIHLIYNLKSLQDKMKSKQPSILGFVLDNTNTDSGGKILTELSDAIKNKVPSILSRRYSLPIVPIFIYSQDKRIKVSVGKAIMPHLSQDEIRQNIVQQFLPFLQTYPDQWVFWAK